MTVNKGEWSEGYCLDLKTAKNKLEKCLIEVALSESSTVKEAAEKLGITRKFLHNLIKKHGLLKRN